MPEGDTIHRAAARLRPALAGRELIRFEAARLAGQQPEPGETVDAVRAVGKHLVVEFSGGLALRVHLRMTGSWHLYETGERWRRRPSTARVVIEVPGWVAVCFNAPDVALTSRDQVATDHLGPDLCDPHPDISAAVTRARAVDPEERSIGEVVMDQRVASGIGNVYKSETLHACRLDPTTPVSNLTDDDLHDVFEMAHRLMRASLSQSGPRKTVAEGYAVYRRADRSCRRCGSSIVRIVQGSDQPRSTYWCPGCQIGRP